MTIILTDQQRLRKSRKEKNKITEFIRIYLRGATGPAWCPKKWDGLTALLGLAYKQESENSIFSKYTYLGFWDNAIFL
jgi:hypothetical protein